MKRVATPFLIMALCSSSYAAAASNTDIGPLLDALESGERLAEPVSRVSAPDNASEQEPDNSFGAANGVAIDGMITGSINQRGDSDWWRMHAPRRGELRLNSTRAPDGVDLNVRLWNANRDTISGWVSAKSPGGPLEAVFDVPSAGDVILELRDGRDDAASESAYEIDLAFTAVPELDEPNDNFGQAAPKPVTASVPASILPRGDSDWFRIETPDQGELHVLVSEVPAELDLTARIWNADRDTVSGWVSAKAAGGPLDARFDLPRPGAYVVELRDGRDDARSAGAFEVAFEFLPTGDLGEPNNSFGAAAELDLGVARPITILPRGDSDWYAVRVPGQGALQLEATEVPESLDVTYRVWNENRDTVSPWYSPLANGGDTIGVTDLDRAGRYVIEIRDGRDDARDATPFRVRATFTETGDGFEPNDSFGSASVLPLDVENQASILPKGDSDWYMIEAASQGALELVLAPPEGLDLTFRVWDANRDTLSGWIAPLATGGETRGVVDLPREGRYVVEVRDGRDDARDPLPYRITAKLAPSGDTHEPNNSFGVAADLELGVDTRAAILPRGDSDWYSLDVAEQGRLNVSITAPPPELDITWRLWNENRDTISGWFAPLARGGDNVGFVDLARAGRYVLEIRDGRDDNRDPAPYALRVDLAPTGDQAEPNDSFGNAQSIETDQPVEGAILPAKDADWFRVPVSVGKLQVTIDQSPPELDMNFRIWNENRDTVSGWFSASAKGGPVSGEIGIEENGVRFIEVRDGRDDAAATAHYRLIARLVGE